MNRLTNSIILTISILCYAWSSNGQNDINKVLEQIMDNARNNKYEKIDVSALYKPSNADEALSALLPYYSDTIDNVRSKAYSITNKIGNRNSKLAVQQQCVNRLLEACKDNDAGINSLAGNYLKYYKKEAFTNKAKDSLRSLLKLKPAHFNKIILLAGYLELSDQTNILKQVISMGKNRKAKWAAHLALARIGLDEEIGFLLSRIKKLPVNDDVVYELLPDLVYTRQKEAINYLIEILNSDVESCESSNPELGGDIICGYRVMEMLAPVIKNFPLKTGESGDIITNDYKKALQTARKWFADHKKDYEIDRDTF